MARLEQRNVRVLRTDRGGQIRFLTDGKYLDVTAFRGLRPIDARTLTAAR